MLMNSGFGFRDTLARPAVACRAGLPHRIRISAIPESLVVKLLEGIKDQVASGSADRALKAGDVAPALIGR
jgi:hypothetical protein